MNLNPGAIVGITLGVIVFVLIAVIITIIVIGKMIVLCNGYIAIGMNTSVVSYLFLVCTSLLVIFPFPAHLLLLSLL